MLHTQVHVQKKGEQKRHVAAGTRGSAKQKYVRMQIMTYNDEKHEWMKESGLLSLVAINQSVSQEREEVLSETYFPCSSASALPLPQFIRSCLTVRRSVRCCETLLLRETDFDKRLMLLNRFIDSVARLPLISREFQYPVYFHSYFYAYLPVYVYRCHDAADVEKREVRASERAKESRQCESETAATVVMDQICRQSDHTAA